MTSRTLIAIALLAAGCTGPQAESPRRGQEPAAQAPAATPPAATPPSVRAALIGRSWDFESADTGWSIWGTNDGQDEGAQRRAVARVGDGAHGGSGALSVGHAAGTPAWYAVAEPGLTVAPRRTWQLSAWVRCTGTAQPAPVLAVSAECDAAPYHLGWIARKQLPVATTWTRVAIVIPAEAVPAAAQRLRPGLFPVGDGGTDAAGRVLIDDVRLEEVRTMDLDLSAAYNRGLRDEVAADGDGGWTDQGDNDMRGLKPGRLAVGGVPFTVADPADHGGKAVCALSPQRGFAASAEIAVGEVCDRVVLLHAAAWCRGRVGSVVWTYADGQAESKVMAGAEVGDWWNGMATAAASLALRGANPTREPVYLFATAIANPHPDRMVRSIGLRAGDGQAIWLVLAAQAGTGPDPMATALAAGDRDRSAWTAFSPAPAAAAQPLLDLSAINHRPAGAKGFVRSEGGRLLFADGTRARFWGTNIHAGYGIFPSHEQAERVATTLSRFGCNLVRLHLPDYALIDYTRPDHQTFVGEDQLERFDYLVKCLVERGIYLVADGVAGLSGGGKERFTAADGVEAGYIPHRPGAYVVPRLRELAQDFARKLLTRRNVHTGRSLAEEPGVAFMIIQNEQSVFFDWFSDGAAMPASYRAMLEGRFAGWLRAAYRDRDALAAAWAGELAAGDDLAVAVQLAPLTGIRLGADSGMRGPDGAHRRQDTVRFLQDLQAGYDRDMTAYLRGLGVRVPIMGTNLVFTPAELWAQRGNDLTSRNAYYDHVRRIDDRRLSFHNRPQPLLDLLSGERDLETSVTAARLAGLPVTSTETDTMFPMEWRASYGLATPATAALQDWDAFLHYCYFGGYGYRWDLAERTKGVLQPTVEFNDPALIGLFPAAALMYLRQDVAPARARVEVLYGAGSRTALNQIEGRGAFPFGYLTHVARADSAFDAPVGTPDALVGDLPAGARGVAWPSGDPAAATRAMDAELKRLGVIPADRGLQGQALVSDTGEVRHDWGRGTISVDSPRTQGVTGFPGRDGIRLRDVAIAMPAGGFATVVVSSLDGEPIAASRRLLLTAVARAENDGMTATYGEVVTAPDGSPYGERATFTRPAGEPGQIRIEPVRARISLPGRSARITALAGDLTAAAPARASIPDGDGRFAVELGQGVQSVWYVLDVER